MKTTVVKVKRQLQRMALLNFIFGSNPKEEIHPDCPPTKRENKLNNLCMIHDLFLHDYALVYLCIVLSLYNLCYCHLILINTFLS